MSSSHLPAWTAFDDGQVHGIFGPSGSGKTTYLRQLIGLNRTPPCYPNEVAFLAQDPHLIPHDTIRRQALWVGDQDALQTWAERLGLSDDILDRYPRALSGGEYQRAALLRVLVTERPVLILDEPLSQVQKTLRVAILQHLRASVAGPDHPRRLIISSHHWHDLWLFADTLMVAEHGSVTEPKPLDEVYRNPPTPTAAKLFGYVASVPGPRNGHWLIHPEALGLGHHPSLGITLTGSFHATMVGVSIRQWTFISDQPRLEIEWPGLPTRLHREKLPDQVHIIDPPWVPYHLKTSPGVVL